jgi:hypothetical protein
VKNRDFKTLSAGVAREREVGEAVINQARGKRCQKRIVGAGRPVRETTNIAANADAKLDRKEIDPAGRKRPGPADQRKQQVRQLAKNLRALSQMSRRRAAA